MALPAPANAASDDTKVPVHFTMPNVFEMIFMLESQQSLTDQNFDCLSQTTLMYPNFFYKSKCVLSYHEKMIVANRQFRLLCCNFKTEFDCKKYLTTMLNNWNTAFIYCNAEDRLFHVQQSHVDYF